MNRARHHARGVYLTLDRGSAILRDDRIASRIASRIAYPLRWHDSGPLPAVCPAPNSGLSSK